MSQDICCNFPSSLHEREALDQTKGVDARYKAAAKVKEACLCSPVAFDPKLLEAIPLEVIDRDYGCGNPTRWVHKGDSVLDLGSGSGKNAFICAQLAGASGSIIGIDRNIEMLELASRSAQVFNRKIGYSKLNFYRAP